MFGGSNSNSSGSKSENDFNKSEGKALSPDSSPKLAAASSIATVDESASNEKSNEKRSGNGSGNGNPSSRHDVGASTEKKRRSSGVGSRASSLLASAKNSLNFSQVTRSGSDVNAQTPLQKLGKQDPALAVPQGQHNNSAGESLPGPKSTFRVGVWEDRNRKCRRTMEDTHAFLYNFLDTPAPAADGTVGKEKPQHDDKHGAKPEVVESDNGYFAIFDGHAGTFAADWCGKKLHIILEDMIRKHPTVPIPELMDMTFTAVDAQLEKLPLKNSGCTAAIAVLRWEERVPSDRSVTGSVMLQQAAANAAASKATKRQDAPETEKEREREKEKERGGSSEATQQISSGPIAVELKGAAARRRVLYTANVGDARIILCRGGKALRLSYDHKGSDENEGRRIANAGGLILNNRVNGVLAVTRALGDAYMKDLVTGHPFTTETVIESHLDEFIIIACDGLWDVCTDQEAVDLVRDMQDPTAASKLLVDHALNRFSTDNLSCMIIRLDKEAYAQSQKSQEAEAGPGSNKTSNRISEADKIVMETKQKIAEGKTSALGVSASNSGYGHDNPSVKEGEFVPTMLDGTLEEEPAVVVDEDSPEVTADALESATLEPDTKQEAKKPAESGK